MGEYALEHPAPDTDLEDCDFAQFERELRADRAFAEGLDQLNQRKETNHDDHGERQRRT